ncbi:aminopeptidase P family protein [Nanchangia anserum]|uniref:Xaa-Pro aminopeptidase n=1 Tax=Nanchangia anserum TaxID=2692125 RepID=A0A8I0KPM1_9ACTO|nr:aminopeptidase P family protein [Nanchangia anserum]MBD3689045.1 aminopeptidase P family protein [Nanchangia anserum]QOX81289.1 aminopeptidase P family protein [Nanchangia anserum]
MSNDISLSGKTGRDDQPLSDRVNNRSRRAGSQAFRDFVGTGWAPRATERPATSGAAPHLAQRHHVLGEPFLGQRLVIPAGTYKVRSNDTDYRFRAHSAFAHLTGLGGELEPDAVLVLEPLTDADGSTLQGRRREGEETHRGVLFFKPQAPRTSEEFYADSRYGEFWVGPRYTLEDMEAATGLEVADIAQLPDQLAKDAGQLGLRVIRNVDAHVQAMVDEVRTQAGLATGEDARAEDEALEERASTIRLIKDAYEVGELEHAIAITKTGFEEIIASLPRALGHHRGERVIEGAFGARAREDGNGLGYDTIAASGNHANTLHWIDNDGEVHPGDLVLVDAGVEADSLYTADITRTLPVDGTFTDDQREVYEAVLEACEAGLAKASEPGAKFRDVHDAAVAVLVRHLDRWGVLPCSAEEALSEEGQQFRRWMPHGVSHHLGLDVHDCAQAARELYLDAELKPGMCFTIEPGLYFHADDELLPERFRGMGVRIEDDIVIDADGTARRMSEDIPRTVADVEAWIAEVQSR